MERGQIKMIGKAEDVVEQYLACVAPNIDSASIEAKA